jgi:hypothetical protein
MNVFKLDMYNVEKVRDEILVTMEPETDQPYFFECLENSNNVVYLRGNVYQVTQIHMHDSSTNIKDVVSLKVRLYKEI